MTQRLLIAAALALFAAGPAFAHTATGVPSGLASGVLHPLTGLDHVVAMVAVGLWAAQLRAAVAWLLPATFLALMAFGGVLGVLGVPLPGTEVMIGLSALVLGGAVAIALRAPAWGAALVVGVFAVFHGFAHGREMPGAADALAYGAGFIAATAVLHAAGIGIGLLTRWRQGSFAVRALGAGIAGLGGVFLLA